MAVENITLNLIPTGDTPSIHVAQFDVDRPFNVTLKEGEDDFTPTGYDIELQVRKVDATIVTVIPTSTSSNVVTFNTTEQMTACSGTNIAELQLTKDSQTFATLHFYLVVQRDVLAGGVTSESDIYNLTEQIAAIVPEVIGDDYYNKEEVDEKIAEIPTFDPTNYYDKSDVDTLLNGKADVSDLPDMTNYYDKSETDTLLNNKADKTVVDAIKLLSTVKSASGSIATFDTDLTETLINCVADNLASKLVIISGNVTNLATYIRGIYQGNYGFVDLGSLSWRQGTSVFYAQNYLPTKLNASDVIPNILCIPYTATSYSNITRTDKSISIDINNGAALINDSSYTTETDLKNSLNGVYLIYELATPTTPTITQTELTNICTSFGVSGVVTDLPTNGYPNTYNGNNNVFVDVDDISVQYLITIGKAISD